MAYIPVFQELRGEILSMASEEEEEDDDEAGRGSAEDQAAERQRRLWSAEPTRRDDILPYFVWSIVHDIGRQETDLNAFVDVRYV